MNSVSGSFRSAFLAWIGNEIATLHPGCFALVMATGIISNALFFEGFRGWADALFVVNLRLGAISQLLHLEAGLCRQ